MADEKKKPEDLSKIATKDLITEYAKLKEKQETALQKEAVKQLKFPPPNEDDLQEAEGARVDSTTKQMEKNLKAKGEKAFRPELEKSYRGVETINNEPKKF